MKVEFLKDIALMVAGKNTGQIVDLLFDKKNVNEFLIAKKLGLTINQTRNILYKLSDEGLVSFTRKKDKKKGWYTYFWTFNTDKALVLLKKKIIEDIDQFEHQLKSREIKRFYICKTCNFEITEENALVHNFTCPECGEVYELYDNKKSINEITSQINRLKKELIEIEKELDIINKDKKKKVEREAKKVEKEKVERRRKAQFERQKERKKLERKLNKGKKKIKPVKKASKNLVKKKAFKKIIKKKKC